MRICNQDRINIEEWLYLPILYLRSSTMDHNPPQSPHKSKIFFYGILSSNRSPQESFCGGQRLHLRRHQPPLHPPTRRLRRGLRSHRPKYTGQSIHSEKVALLQLLRDKWDREQDHVWMYLLAEEAAMMGIFSSKSVKIWSFRLMISYNTSSEGS